MLRSIVLAGVAALILSAPASAASKKGHPWGENYFPNVPLITHEGKEVRFYDDLIKGKVVAINFIFTSCPSVCPAETAKLRQVQKVLGDRVGNDVFMYSISIDPETDTPEVLKAYREKFNIGPGWTFLTGKEEDITLLRKKLGLYIKEIQNDENGEIDHNVSLILGNEPSGRWIKRSPYDNPRILASVIGDWLHDWKPPLPADAAVQSYTEAPTIDVASRGEYLFNTRCSSCHSLGGGDGVGPDLLGVTKKRDPKWLARWLKDPDKLLAEKDPVAMQLLAEYEELEMPNLGLGDVDVDALIEYLSVDGNRQKLSAR
jgi:protein SCO1/2